jgi:hypothetical protein
MYLKYRLTKVCILHRISLVTGHDSHPYKSIDFTQALKILILVSFLIDVDSHTFLSSENDAMAFCVLTLTSVLAPPSSAKETSYSLQQFLWYFENHNVLLAYDEGHNTEFVCLRTIMLVLTLSQLMLHICGMSKTFGGNPTTSDGCSVINS